MKEIWPFGLWNIKSIFAQLVLKVIKAWGFRFDPLQEDVSLSKKDIIIK